MKRKQIFCLIVLFIGFFVSSTYAQYSPQEEEPQEEQPQEEQPQEEQPQEETQFVPPILSEDEQETFFDFVDAKQEDAWKSWAGNWRIEGGLYCEYRDEGGPLLSTTGSSELTDYTIIVRAMGLIADGDWGIVFRFVDNNNFYTWQFVNSTLALQKYINGSATTIFSMPQKEFLNVWQEFKVVVKGNIFECYWNGELKTTSTDSDIASGSVGLFGWVNSGSTLGDTPRYLAFDNFYLITKKKLKVSNVWPFENYR